MHCTSIAQAMQTKQNKTKQNKTKLNIYLILTITHSYIHNPQFFWLPFLTALSLRVLYIWMESLSCDRAVRAIAIA